MPDATTLRVAGEPNGTVTFPGCVVIDAPMHDVEMVTVAGLLLRGCPHWPVIWT